MAIELGVSHSKQMVEFVFILVAPSVPENVGAAARAIKTMGFDQMRLVTPCDHLCDQAKWLAHASHEILENALIFDSLQSAVRDMDFVIGTTAKSRSVKKEYHLPSHLHKIINCKGSMIHKVGIVFGREESGLTNEELGLCDVASSVPLIAPYPSINLAQSVMIYAYELSDLNTIKQNETPEDKSKGEEYKAILHIVGSFLSKTGMSDNPLLENRIMERLALASATDLHLIMSIIKHIEKGRT